MNWQYLFSPIYAAAFLWLGTLIAALVWLASRVFRSEPERPLWTRVLVPIAVLMGLSFPLWLSALTEEIQCRSAGLQLDARVEGPSVSIYWQSFSPDPHAYSLGALTSRTPLGGEAMREMVRALAEGRLSAFEIPYEPTVSGVSESARLNQRFFLKSTHGGSGKCLLADQYQRNLLPPETCIAFETSQGIQSRYEMRGQAFVSEQGRDASIVDRETGKTIASHKFVTQDTGETLLAFFGVRKLRPMSCTPVMGRTDLSTALIPLVFGSEVSPRVEVGKLLSFRASPWKAVAAAPVSEPVPEGIDGIKYWLQKGAIRHLQQADLDLWNGAVMPLNGKPHTGVPRDAYLVVGEMRLPDGLYGAHSVKWIVAENARVPPGPRGHNTFYQVGKGCVWAPGGCPG
jgi:hypothetical protein